MLARAHKKFQSGQHSEIYLLPLKEQDKTKMELPLGMVSKHAFWYLYLPDYCPLQEVDTGVIFETAVETGGIIWKERVLVIVYDYHYKECIKKTEQFWNLSPAL